MTLKEMRARLKQAHTELAALKAKLESGDATVEEVKSVTDLIAEMNDLTKAVKDSSDALRALGDVRPDDATGDSETRGIRVPATVVQEAPKFKTFGEQLQAVATASMNKGSGGFTPHPALKWQAFDFKERAIQGANTIVPSEGGFLVQQDFSTSLLDLAHESGTIMNRVTPLSLSTNANSIKLPMVDETSRANGSRWGGVVAYWVAEGAAGTASKPKFREANIGVEKLMCIGYATDEMLQDAAILQTIMMKAFAEEIVFMTEDAIVNGDGSGKPLGFMNSGALISVAKESGQAADTIVAWNILKMMARLPIRSMTRAVWLINQDCLPQLWAMKHPNSDVLMFQPPGLNNNVEGNAPYGTLMGRPVFPVEQAATVGDVGDLTLVDLDHYLLLTKGGVQTATSMHVEFLTDQMTFRLVYRVGGQTTINTAITPKNGTKTTSPFVALAAR